MPFDGSVIIPAGWSAHHQPVIDKAANSIVKVVDPSRAVPGVMDDDTGIQGPDRPFVVIPWTRARIVRFVSADVGLQGGQEVSERPYLVQLPTDVDVNVLDPLSGDPVGYEVTVLEAANDPLLVGKTLHVDDVLNGSERWSLDLFCTINNG